MMAKQMMVSTMIFEPTDDDGFDDDNANVADDDDGSDIVFDDDDANVADDDDDDF
jgi:hypothetical protein